MSDIHNCFNKSTSYVSDLLDAMVRDITNTCEGDHNLCIIICGDIINKGETEGYSTAILFLQELENKLKQFSVTFLCCPGNHDIIKSNMEHTFINFDRFQWQLTHNSKFLFGKSGVIAINVHDFDFIMVNSAHHGDIAYGKINLNDLERVINPLTNPIIIIFHHHMIPVTNETSTIVNTSEFLALINNYKVKLILHGHLHMGYIVRIGTQATPIIGSGTILSEPTENINNQFNLIQIINSKIMHAYSFKLIADQEFHGRRNSFKKTEMVW